MDKNQLEDCPCWPCAFAEIEAFVASYSAFVPYVAASSLFVVVVVVVDVVATVLVVVEFVVQDQMFWYKRIVGVLMQS